MEQLAEKTGKYTTYTYDYRSYATKPDDFSSPIDVFETDKKEVSRTGWLDDFGWL